MDISTSAEGLRQTDQGEDQRGHPIVRAVLQELCSNEQTPPGNSQELCVPAGCALETFADGAGT